MEFRRVLFRSVYHPLWAAFPSNPTPGRPGPGAPGAATGLTPSTGWASIRRTWAPHERRRGAGLPYATWTKERSEERRVGKECRSRGWAEHGNKKTEESGG